MRTNFLTGVCEIEQNIAYPSAMHVASIFFFFWPTALNVGEHLLLRLPVTGVHLFFVTNTTCLRNGAYNLQIVYLFATGKSGYFSRNSA